MLQPIRMSQGARELLRCPTCHEKLEQTGQQFACANSDCDTHFPIVDGTPVLLNEKSSVFSISSLVSRQKTYFNNVPENKVKEAILRFVPAISKNIKGKSNYRRLTDLLLRECHAPRVLVIGGSVLGQGMEPLINNDCIDMVETDVSFGDRAMLICDAHDIPFADGSFDAVIVQAVLEHVVDPFRCCDEIHRVLKEDGIVYAETPFMQQVHGGRVSPGRGPLEPWSGFLRV
jgi:uncharacterized protein YbaR (Trm112 family)/SAM-dependent methyltransferase